MTIKDRFKDISEELLTATGLKVLVRIYRQPLDDGNFVHTIGLTEEFANFLIFIGV